VADDNRTTLYVAVAGIAATALIGLAATTAAWLSARDDRATQRALARDERTYERRVSVYLDAIDFLQGQVRSIETYMHEGNIAEGNIAESRSRQPRDVPIDFYPPDRLETRLRAFGSKAIYDDFVGTELQTRGIPVVAEFGEPGDVLSGIIPAPKRGVSRDFNKAYQVFRGRVNRFERLVHEDVG
jgi:hypothetical protein